MMQAGSGDSLIDNKATSRVGSAAYWQADGETMYASNEVDTSLDITDGFHNYTMEWTPNAITTFVDGIELFSIDISDSRKDEFHKPFNFVINVAVGGSYTGIDEKDEITAPLPAELVVDYIRIYDNGFTNVSDTPAAASTREPTATTTAAPTRAPTAKPTKVSTSVPIPESSTSNPTLSPTLSSTVTPTSLPSLSNESSSETTVSPSREPTPLSAPSPSPTAAPTARSLQVLEASVATMTFSGLDPLDSTLAKKWQQVTGNHLQVEIIQMLGANLVDSCKVNVTLISQASRRVLTDNALRNLQAETIELSFNSIISIQSNVTEHDANGYIRDSFKSERQNDSFVDSLKESDAFFENVTLDSVTTGPSISRGVQAPQNDDTGPSIGFISGMAAAGAAIIVLNALLLMKWRQKKRSSQPLSQQPERARSPTGSGPLPLEDDDSFYVIARKDSSARRSHRLDEEEREDASTSSSITNDSNYPMVYDPMSSSSSLFDLGSIQSDETSTRVTEFEVIVPAGPLGIVLETDSKGVSVVQQIKSSSPLEEEVQVGDRLIIVDGMDVTMLGAAGVSHLIRAKKDKPMRKFVFSRPE
jgi:hypothetical protein